MSWPAQVRQLVESSFVPLACDCVIVGDGSMTVRIYDHDTGRVDLMVTGIAVTRIKTREDVAVLIEELRDELASVSGGCRDLEPSSEA